jgi:hypothetical protein
MRATQNDTCAICKQPETVKQQGKQRRLSIDHDHTTNQVRDLLCSNCNTMLGFFDDNPELLEAAAAYLTKHRQNAA